MTFEEFVRSEVRRHMQRHAPEQWGANGTCDFRFRATVQGDRVDLYVHPLGHDGMTTPTLVLRGNEIIFPTEHDART